MVYSQEDRESEPGLLPRDALPSPKLSVADGEAILSANGYVVNPYFVTNHRREIEAALFTLTWENVVKAVIARQSGFEDREAWEPDIEPVLQRADLLLLQLAHLHELTDGGFAYEDSPQAAHGSAREELDRLIDIDRHLHDAAEFDDIQGTLPWAIREVDLQIYDMFGGLYDEVMSEAKVGSRLAALLEADIVE